MFVRSASIAMIAILSVAGAAVPALAQAVPTKEVRTADLDLSSDAGVAKLNSRILRASRAVCGGRPEANNLAAIARFNACFAQAKAGASDKAERMVAAAQSGERTAMQRSADVVGSR